MKQLFRRACALTLAGACTLTAVPTALASDTEIPAWLDTTGSSSTGSTGSLGEPTGLPGGAQTPANVIMGDPPGTTYAPDGTPTYPAGTIRNADGTLTGPDGLVYSPWYYVPAVTAEEATALLRAQDPELAAAGMLSFYEVEDLVRSQNLTVLSNRETLDSITAVDLDEAAEELEDAIDSLEDAADGLRDLADEIDPSGFDFDPSDLAGLGDVMGALIGQLIEQTALTAAGTQASLEMHIANLESQIAQLESQLETIENTDYEQYERQFENIEDQLVLAAQSAYIGLATLQQNYVSLMQQSSLVESKRIEMQKRYELGQIAQLDLLEVENSKAAVDSSLETVQLTLRNTKGDLNLLLGRDASENFILDALPEVTPAQLAAVNLADDQARAHKASYDIYAAEVKLEEAENAEGEGRKAGIRAAEYALEAAEQSFDQSFLKLYRALYEKNRLVTVAEGDQELAARKLEAATLKYQQGSISRSELIESELDKAEADNAVRLAEIDLFSAWNQYQWACEGVLAATGGMTA